MSRRPRRNRPPRLDDPTPVPPPAVSGPQPRRRSARRRLLDAHVTGAHLRLGREGVGQAVRALVRGDPHARLGCDGLDGCTADEVRAALAKTHGWDPAPRRAAIDPDATLTALAAAADRLRAAASGGARVAVATSRPASLLGLAQWVAGEVAGLGATVLASTTAPVEGLGRRSLWWVGDVAVVTDGRSLLAHDGVPGGDDWLFAVGRPDLVAADRCFAGAALRAGVETIAWADLDAPALALAAARGRPVLVVPVDEQRPAPAYDAVIAVLEGPPGPPGPPDPPDPLSQAGSGA
ncbi:MAG: phosphatase [Actinomycetota bacterium]